jgi:hypothetical protein
MTLVFGKDGMQELLASGARKYTHDQTKQAFQLLDVIRARGKSDPAFVLSYMHLKAPALEPILASGLAMRGFDTTCKLCARSVDGKRYSRSKLNRLFGVDAPRFEIAQHRKQHMRKRRMFSSTFTVAGPGLIDGAPASDARDSRSQKQQGVDILLGEVRDEEDRAL